MRVRIGLDVGLDAVSDALEAELEGRVGADRDLPAALGWRYRRLSG